LADFQPRAASIIRSQIVSAFGYRYVFDEEHHAAASFAQLIDEVVRGDFSYIAPGDSQRNPMEYSLGIHHLDCLHQFCIYPNAPSRICRRSSAFQADDGQKVAVLVEQLDVFIIDQGAVCKNWENDSVEARSHLDDLPA
jgi:hypothetical protein